jgi:hypothetical protein
MLGYRKHSFAHAHALLQTLRTNLQDLARGRTARPGRRRHHQRGPAGCAKSFIAVVSLIIGFAGVVAVTPARGAEADVHAALQRWVETLGSGKGEAPIAALYAPDAILLSTFDPKPLETPAEIAAYFHKLTQNPNLKATVQTEKIHTFADGGADSGLYTFSYTKDGNEVRVPARFTFVFHRTTAGWLIVSHHSSVVPPGP